MSKSLTNKLYLKQKLYGLKMAKGSDLSQHINMFNHIISDLKRIDVKFEDEDKALMLLNSLSASSTYENLVTTLMWGKETQGEGLVAKSNQERGRNKLQSESSNNKSRSKSKKRKDIQCYKCGKKGHMKQDCPEKKKGAQYHKIKRVHQSLRI